MATLRTVSVSVSQLLPPAERSRLLAKHARAARDALIREGRAAPSFQTFVDGREGAAEETVRPDGVVRYVFSSLARAAAFTLSYLEGASPKRAGDFARSWIVVVNGARWQGNLATVPAGATVHILNTSPYARRLEVGLRRRPGLGFELVKKAGPAIARKFPGLAVTRRFLTWPGAYVLKTDDQVTRGAEGRRKRGVQFASIATRKDRRAGQRITIPAIEIQEGGR